MLKPLKTVQWYEFKFWALRNSMYTCNSWKPSCLLVARSHKLISLSSELVQENVSCRLLEPNVLYLSFLMSWFSLSEFFPGLLSLYVRDGWSLGALAKMSYRIFKIGGMLTEAADRHSHPQNLLHPLQPPPL